VPHKENEAIETQAKWIEVLSNKNAYWHHDGNLNRPYALLTSGKISNFFANCSVITKSPLLLTDAASDLFRKMTEQKDCLPDAFVGSAYGAITLAYELARHGEDYWGGDTEAWFTAKGEDDTMELDRFEFSSNIKSVIMVEDVITTFKTTRASIAALRPKAHFGHAKILPYVLCIVNRSGQSEIDGFKIISLIEVNNALTWEPGQNPFLGKEPERVSPVRPK
jgi:orotate phosphoribosyltransferase